MNGDIMYINRIVVDEEYKGMGLGLLLLEACDSLNSITSLTLIKPFPLQYENVDRDDGEGGEKIDAMKGLDEAKGKLTH
jgi:hypothetical protein